MRLLREQSHGGVLFVDISGAEPPPYAILSHMWDPDDPAYDDIQSGAAINYPGYSKIRFCSRRAAEDGLDYFWIGTCCIDKLSSADLSHAVNSMYSWFQGCRTCYVYLSDVSFDEDASGEVLPQRVELEFSQSRWFTRSWTLQELLAPKSVEFFSCEGRLIGDKEALSDIIHDITGIPIDALRGAPLSSFSVAERMRWAQSRNALTPEDEAYSLFGLFGVNMPLLYGEGGEHAFARLTREIDRHADDVLDRRDSLEGDDASSATQDLDTGQRETINYDHTAEEPFVYHPLAETEFRIFVIEPGSMGSNIVGQTRTFGLSAPPVYYSLSYTWGSEPMVHQISINGSSKLIQPTLFHALQRIRPRMGQYYLWVDSICINQRDSSERNAQVRQMASIYHKASGVLVWLGEEDSTSRIALSFVSSIISPKFDWAGAWWDRYEFNALADILVRPWFRRGWVLQEAAFSRFSTIRCGDAEVYMDHFIMAIDLVRAKSRVAPAASLANFHDSPAIRLADIVEGAFLRSANGEIVSRKLPLETLVDLAVFSETTDQRDTVYTLLNIANDIGPLLDSNTSDAIVPDYDKSVLDVYVGYILHCCNRSESLDIICRPWAPNMASFARITAMDNQTYRTLSRYPSWIAPRDGLPFGNPVQQSQHRLHGIPLVGSHQKRVYSASRGTKPRVRAGVSSEGACDGSLYVKGVVLGEIGRRSTRMANAIISRDCLQNLRPVSYRTIPDHIGLPDPVWRTLCADRNGSRERAPRFYRAAMVQLLEINRESLSSGHGSDFLDGFCSIDIEELLESDIPDIVEEFLLVVRDTIWNRRTFQTKTDNAVAEPLVGLIPPKANLGDLICIFYGCSVPVVLRKLCSVDSEQLYCLIGSAYVDGIMDGEVLEPQSSRLGELKEMEFKIM